MRWRNLGRIGTGLRVINRLRFDPLVIWEKELTYGAACAHSLKIADRSTIRRAVGGPKVLTKGPSAQYERRNASFIHHLGAGSSWGQLGTKVCQKQAQFQHTTYLITGR